MFVTCNALLTNLNFGKGESQEGEAFFILRFTYLYNVNFISPLFFFPDTKRVTVTTTAKRPQPLVNTNYFIEIVPFPSLLSQKHLNVTLMFC